MKPLWEECGKKRGPRYRFLPSEPICDGVASTGPEVGQSRDLQATQVNPAEAQISQLHLSHESAPARLHVQDERGQNLALFIFNRSGSSEADLQHIISLDKCK